MKIQLPILAALFLAGCNSTPTQTAVAPTSAPVKSVVVSEKERLAKFCRVCDIEHGKHGEEYLPMRLNKTVDGKKYRFCATICREKFDKNPKKYLVKS